MTERAGKYDLTTGGILRKLMLVAVPIMGTQLVQMSYNLMDMFWLGRLSSNAVAASGTAGMFMWLSMAFVIIGRLGAEIGVSQNLGYGDKDAAKRYGQNAMFLATILGVLYGVTLVTFRGQFVGFFNIQEANVAADAKAYLGIVGLAMPFMFLTNPIIGMFNASGNSRTPFVINAIGLVINMVLDPLLIFTLGLGIEGAAYATGLAQIVVFALMMYALMRTKNRPFERFELFVKPKLAYIRQILKWSLPVGVESLLFTTMSMITSRFVAGFGADAMAVSRVGSQAESLSWLIAGGFGSALTTFMGQNFGAGKWARIHKGFRMSSMVMLGYGALITGVLFFGAEFLFSLFLPGDADIIAMGVMYLRILAICQIPQCFEAVAGSIFKGTGQTLPPSIVSISSNVLRVFCAYFFARTALGINGIWLALTLTATLRGLWSFVWCLSVNRRRPKVDMPVS